MFHARKARLRWEGVAGEAHGVDDVTREYGARCGGVWCSAPDLKYDVAY